MPFTLEMTDHEGEVEQFGRFDKPITVKQAMVEINKDNPEELEFVEECLKGYPDDAEHVTINGNLGMVFEFRLVEIEG